MAVGGKNVQPKKEIDMKSKIPSAKMVCRQIQNNSSDWREGGGGGGSKCCMSRAADHTRVFSSHDHRFEIFHSFKILRQ